MEEDELIDEPTIQKRPFNKSPLLYGLVTIVMAGFVFRNMHWPGSSLLMLFGGGFSVGYCVTLLIFYHRHAVIENVIFALYVSGITVFVINTYNSMGWMLYAGALLLTLLLSWYFLKDREIS
ncbi:MAG TPA: hypothetical protein VK177_05170 [Flavobacteriales bacterium]|nr:hypothetical protein [Flavobacteriales bacterium]